MQRTRDLRSLLYPRAQMATIAKAYGLQAIDMVCIEYKDDAYLREECRDGASLGFDGKQAIHPAQLDAIHAAYSPSKEGMYKLLTQTWTWLGRCWTHTGRAPGRARAPWAWRTVARRS